MENNEQKVVLEVADITSRQGMDIINMIKDIPMEGRQMRMMSASAYDKPTSSSCEYCDLKGIYDFIGYYQVNELSNSLYFAKDTLTNHYYLLAYRDMECGIEIKYCPFCGRYLGGEDAD